MSYEAQAEHGSHRFSPYPPQRAVLLLTIKPGIWSPPLFSFTTTNFPPSTRHPLTGFSTVLTTRPKGFLALDSRSRRPSQALEEHLAPEFYL